MHYIGYISMIAGYLILPVFILTIVFCVRAWSKDSLIMLTVLTLLELAAWVDSIWLDPLNLGIVHLFIFTSLYAMQFYLRSLVGKFGDRVLLLTSYMAITDAVFYVFSNWYLSFHLFIINALFLTICYFTMKACNNALKRRGENKDKGNAAIYAMVEEEDIIYMPRTR